MRLDYDLDAAALYIQLLDDGTPAATTKEIDEETFVDVTSEGTVIGIEVINPSRRWPLDEILTAFPFAEEDQQQLKAYFQGQTRPPTPAISVEKSAPLCIA
jgi:uncharacterized protein YuzE